QSGVTDGDEHLGSLRRIMDLDLLEGHHGQAEKRRLFEILAVDSEGYYVVGAISGQIEVCDFRLLPASEYDNVAHILFLLTITTILRRLRTFSCRMTHELEAG